MQFALEHPIVTCLLAVIAMDYLFNAYKLRVLGKVIDKAAKGDPLAVSTLNEIAKKNVKDALEKK